MKIPEDREIIIVAIQAEDVQTLREEMTPAVEAAIPRAMETVLGILLE
jgi:Ni,Fe-hydrogenase maturation factor